MFIRWVAAGLTRPATAAAAATATAAATFIDWIDLAAPPVIREEGDGCVGPPLLPPPSLYVYGPRPP